MRIPVSEAVVANFPGQRRMLDVVRGALRSSSRVSIAVSFFRFSGFGLIADDLKDFQARGGTLRLLVSTYMSVTQPEALQAVLKFPSVISRLHIADRVSGLGQGFHAKMYVIEDAPAEGWVGSSNFTKGGLAANIEANLRHMGAAEVAGVQSLFEQLWSRLDTQPLTLELIESYRQTIREAELWSAPVPPRKVADLETGYGASISPNEAQAEALGII